MSEVLRGFRGGFVAIAGFSLVMNLLMLMPTVYMLQVYDRVLPSRNETTLLMLTLIMVGVFALEVLLEVLRSRALVRIGASFDAQMGGIVFDAAFQRYLLVRQGSPEHPFGDLHQLRQFLTGRGLLALFDLPWVPIYVLVVFLLDAWLGIFALLAVVIAFVLAVLNEKLTGRSLAEATRLSLVASQQAGASLRNAEVIAAMGMLERLRLRWQARQAGVLRLQSEASDRAAMVAGLGRFLRLVSQSGVLGLGALLVLEQRLSPGGMFAASILLGRALAPVDMVLATWRGTVAARGSHARLKLLLSTFPSPAARTALPRPEGRVEVDGLTVKPSGGDRIVLHGIGFSVAAGTIVAVTGPSAAGKSSLARALVGVWPVLGGSVRLDGAALPQWDREALGRWIGYLPQDVELFEGTVAENIARFSGPDDAEIVAAAHKAGAHEMILQLPGGYETQIGEGGVSLSAGQRQRIGLARALFGSPALIVLDEPNASLDEAGDRALWSALEGLKRERTTVFVMTHRLNLLALADRVLVLAGGRVQAFGPVDALPQRRSGDVAANVGRAT